MGKAIKNQYQPDTVSPPGETVLDTLAALGISLDELAEEPATQWSDCGRL